MARTTSSQVQGVLAANYDGSTSLTPFIDSASAVVDRVATCATAKGITLSSTELELIERWLAAHLYTKFDAVYASKSTADASGSFVRGPIEPEPYKDAAIAMDYSGCLKAILNRQVASVQWLGKPPSAQIDVTDRD